MTFKVLPITGLKASPLNPRKQFDPVKLQELATSFSGVGIIEPLVVRAVNGHHEIVAGERRFRAAKLAGLREVPTVVRELTDAQVLEIMVVENNQRDDVNALEEADGFSRLIKTGYDIDRLAERIGHTRRYIFDRIKLLDLVPPAKKLLLAGRLPTSHAILLARLDEEQQLLAIDPHQGGTFVGEGGHALDFEEGTLVAAAAKEADPYRDMKPRSVRELQAWIDNHVRFDATAPVSAELFPETASAIEEAEKVIFITHDHYIQPDAKLGNTQRIYTCRSWTLADGSEGRDTYTRKKVVHKTCDRSVTGVIVVGPGRGTSLKVCVHKECEVHWKAERDRRAKAKASPNSQASQAAAKREEEKRRAEQAKEEAQRKAWASALPAIRQACADKLKTAKPGVLAEILARSVRGPSLKAAGAALGKAKPKTAQDFLRLFAMVDLLEESENTYWAPRTFPSKAKRLGVDVAAILKKQAPAKEA